ncbi:MAG: putative LPS assembly protein LptD [Bacteroidota bacterium]
MQIYKSISTQDFTFFIKVQLATLLLIVWSFSIFAQDTLQLSLKDTIPSTIPFDSLSGKLPTDATFYGTDSIPSASVSRGNLDSVKISKDAFETTVDYSAQDSMIYDIKNEKIYLYGNAQVKYETMELTAGFMILDWSTNEVSAEGFIDSTGNLGQFPKFKDGEQDFTAKRMRYNFDTQKGIIYEVSSTQQNLYVIGAKSKIVRTEQTFADTDSVITEDVIYSEDAIFTTCNHPQPHFGIRSTKQKIISNKMIVIGPSRLEVAGIPTPLYIPFGFFPISDIETGGLIFPDGYEYSDQWGFGLRNIRYYFPVNDYMDITASGSIYVKGTFDLGANVNFRKRYKYNGGFSFNYARQRNEASDATISFAPSIKLSARLNQASGAHPTRTIGGSINIQFNNYQSQNFNDAQSVLNQAFNSNFSLNQTFPGKPYNFSAAFTHSQNTRSGTMTINFPNFNFQTQTIYPFKRRNIKEGKSLKEQWYEQIAFRYQGEMRASVSGTDTLSQFFDSENFSRNLNAGAQQRASVNTSLKVLKYFSLNPSVNYTNSINLKYTELGFTNEPITVPDSIVNEFDTTQVEYFDRFVSFGDLTRDTITGFRPIHEVGASLSLNTILYRTWNRKRQKGWLRGFRHTVKPSASFNWSPDYTEGLFNYQETYEERISETETVIREYSPFQNSLYRAPTGQRRAAINFSLNNIYEAKYYSKKDSTEKKLKLFDNFIVNGNYNFAADSLNFSDLSASGTTRLFKGISTFQFRAGWSPYALGENGRRVNQFYYNVTGGKLLRFDQANFRFSTSLSVKQIQDLIKGEESSSSSGFNRGTEIGGDNRERSAERVQDYESLGDWLSRFRVSHNYVIDLKKQADGTDTLQVRTHNFSVSGSIQLSQNWNLNVGNFGYDFKNKGFSYPSFGFQRDLHCWTLAFQWYPTRNVYTLNIAVRDSPLDFIKIPSIRNQADGRFQGFR